MASKMLQGMRIATVAIAVQDPAVETDYFAHFSTRHLDTMLDLCETAWSVGDFGRSVDDEDQTQWGINIDTDFDFPTGW